MERDRREWVPECFLAWYRVSQRKRWLVQVLARKDYERGSDYSGFLSHTGESFIFTGEFLERIG